MADSDDAPASAPPPVEGPPPAPAGAPLPVAPRINPPTLAQRQEASAAEASPASKITLEDLLTWARSFDGTVDPKTPPKILRPTAKRSRIAREKRKFHKIDPEAAKAEKQAAEAQTGEPGAAPKAPADEQEGEEGEDEDFEAGLMVSEDPRKAIRRAKATPRSLLSSVMIQVFILLFIAAGFFLGRGTLTVAPPAPVKRVAPIPADSEKEPTILSPAAVDLVDQAIAAENEGHFKKAAALFDQLRHSSGHIEGLDYQLASLAFRSEDLASAVLSINRSLLEGERVSECYALRGIIANRRGQSRGMRDFEAATQADPFDAKNFFYWGEALRRAGKPQTALTHLQEAVERAQSPGDQAMYALKVRLTQIELGQEKEFANELDAAMALPRPPAEWVLTAAAREMHSGNYPAAAVDLTLARQIMDPALLAGELQDYFFMGYADRPALARIYAEILPGRRPNPAPSPAGTPAGGLPATQIPVVAPPGSPARPADVPSPPPVAP